MKEFEYRYELVGDMPFDLVISKKYIEQVYSSVIGVNNSIVDNRIRKIEADGNTIFYHTTKYNTITDGVRIEIESEISEQEYDSIFKTINKTPLRKNRYIVPLNNGLFAEIDEFIDKGISIIEVEFDSQEQAELFEKSKPLFVGNKITKKLSFSKAIFSYVNLLKEKGV